MHYIYNKDLEMAFHESDIDRFLFKFEILETKSSWDVETDVIKDMYDLIEIIQNDGYLNKGGKIK